MGLTLAKCPACGADLNLEIDRDFFYCPHCGSKVLQQDDRIVIEHINRTVDEAELRKIELEERKRLDEKERNAEADVLGRRIGRALIAMGAICLIASFFTDEHISFAPRMFGFLFGFLGIMFVAIAGKPK